MTSKYKRKKEYGLSPPQQLVAGIIRQAVRDGDAEYLKSCDAAYLAEFAGINLDTWTRRVKRFEKENGTALCSKV